MADEATVRLSLAFEKGRMSDSVALAATTYDVSGNNYTRNIQDVGFAAPEAIALGDLTVGGWCYFRNLEADGGNFVQLYAATGETAFIKLKAGEAAIFPMIAAAPFAQADTAAVRLLFFGIDL